ncbi:PH domain-containing protein [Bifidobacterium sp. 82T10]|uniref:PH domain-containing protein n=2 Tax=Bifidobacterium miconis TaxID=2834435 RepID=A0ABS6WFE7_9BIFI|nr:PH domain-containing protein [Bifidobacterium miconis]
MPSEPATPEPPRHDPSQSVPWNHTNEWRKLPERMDQVWMIGEAVSCACWLAGCAVAAAICWFNGWWHFWQPLVIGLVGAGAILSLASQPLQTRYRYAFNRFMIGDRYLRIRDGWLFRTTTTIPYNRVQHVDTEQGPILRRFGLTTISVHTAVGEHKIESLETAEAERVTALIAERVAVAKEDL